MNNKQVSSAVQLFLQLIGFLLLLFFAQNRTTQRENEKLKPCNKFLDVFLYLFKQAYLYTAAICVCWREQIKANFD